jgi:hypothetical protein
MDLSALIAQYGLVAVFGGCLLEDETCCWRATRRIAAISIGRQ